MILGYFQSEVGQFGCISCDSLGGFYQESAGQTSCTACPEHTQRFVGLLTGANRSSCQCKEGDVSMELAWFGSMDCSFLPCRLLQQRGPVRRGMMPFDTLAPTTRCWHLCIEHLFSSGSNA
jgi:hypothetical protein